MNSAKTSFLSMLGATALLLATAATAADYRLVRRFDVPGPGGWDYLTFDAAGKRLFIARSDRVQVVDVADGRLVGEVAGTAGVHGVALVPSLRKGYASAGRADAITVFDSTSLATLATIATPDGGNPDFIVYDDARSRVLAFNGRTHNATVIDPSVDRVVATIALSGKPEAAVSDGHGRVYVDVEDRNTIAVVDVTAGAVVGAFDLPGCDEPAGLAIDRGRRLLFAGCHNDTMVVVSIDDGSVVASLPIGHGVDANAFDPVTGLAFSAQGDGTLTVVGGAPAGGFAVVQTVATPTGARTMALDPASHDLFVVTAEFDESPAAQGRPGPRRTVRDGTFRVYVFADHD